MFNMLNIALKDVAPNVALKPSRSTYVSHSLTTIPYIIPYIESTHQLHTSQTFTELVTSLFLLLLRLTRQQ